jgi:phosphopantothenoylcysteine synthetase/decarboxylase
VEGRFVPADTRPVLYIVACGAPPAGELTAFVRDAQAQGWNVCVIATPDGSKFIDAGNLSGLTGHPVRVRFKRPDEPDVLPPPNALVVAPATFNTVNKWAQGISDTLALGLLNEAVGLRLPMVAVPWPNAALAAHPVFARSVATLREWGITLILDPGRLPQPGTGEAGTFPWDELRAILPSLRGPKAEPQASWRPRPS